MGVPIMSQSKELTGTETTSFCAGSSSSLQYSPLEGSPSCVREGATVWDAVVLETDADVTDADKMTSLDNGGVAAVLLPSWENHASSP